MEEEGLVALEAVEPVCATLHGSTASGGYGVNAETAVEKYSYMWMGKHAELCITITAERCRQRYQLRETANKFG